jgi:hypothetical protein
MIVGTVESETVNQDTVKIVNPVLVYSVRTPVGQIIMETFIMQTWLKLAKGTAFELSTRNILVTADITEQTETQYRNYIDEIQNETTLDNIIPEYFDGMQEDEQDELMEEDEDHEHKPVRTTYH